MNKDAWQEQYIERLVTKGKMTYREAHDVLQAGMREYDYDDDDPEDSADEEMSYWSDDA